MDLDTLDTLDAFVGFSTHVDIHGDLRALGGDIDGDFKRLSCTLQLCAKRSFNVGDALYS